MPFFLKFLTSVLLFQNYFNKSDVYLGPVTLSGLPRYEILEEYVDERCRPAALIAASTYRDVPSLGNWDGMEVHSKVAPETWFVYYEDFLCDF